MIQFTVFRSSGEGQGEQENTLNQILVEMDGKYTNHINIYTQSPWIQTLLTYRYIS